VIDIFLSIKDDTRLWEASQPVGSESFRIFELVKQLSTAIYDYQRLNLITLRDEHNENETFAKIQSTLAFLKAVADLPAVMDDAPGSPFTKTDNSNLKLNSTSSQNLLPFVMIDVRFPHVIFRQQLLFHELQSPLNFKFPERKVFRVEGATTKPAHTKNQPKKDKNKKAKYSKKTGVTSRSSSATSTSTSTQSALFIGDYQMATTLPTKYSLDRHHFVSSFSPSAYYMSASSFSSTLPSIYFGKTVFNENQLLLPLASKNRSIGELFKKLKIISNLSLLIVFL
jgi:hypothetical protein